MKRASTGDFTACRGPKLSARLQNTTRNNGPNPGILHRNWERSQEICHYVIYFITYVARGEDESFTRPESVGLSLCPSVRRGVCHGMPLTASPRALDLTVCPEYCPRT